MAFKKNKAQENAINTIKGPVMIVSCPGSGKTTTLIRRIHHMIETGVSPENILMVTFSRAAAIEMKEKYEKFFGNNPGILFMTIHSLCFNLLIKEGKYKKENILMESDKYDYLASVLRMYPQAEGDIWEIAKSVSTEITSIKNNYIEIKDFESKECDPEIFRDVFRKYEKWKTDIHKIDFDDMLTKCKEMLEASPAILEKWKNQFLYIQCDEYQDTNMIQRDILYMLSGKERNLCVVGDDDQSIYRFRGARPEIMLHFMDDYPDAKKIMMGTNYRSAGEIVETAGRLIVKNKTRYGKTFESQRGLDGVKGYTEYIRAENKATEMEILPKLIKEIHEGGVEYKDMAVLFRINQQAVLPVSVLSAHNIPFYAADTIKCIYDGWIFKDIRNYVELSCGLYKDNEEMHTKLSAVINKPNRFFNADDFAKVDYNLSGFRQAIYPMHKETYWKYAQATEQIETWMRLFGPEKLTENDNPSEIFKRLMGMNTIGYNKHIADMAKFRRTDPQEYMEEYEELKSDAEKYPTIKEWFAHADWMKKFIRDETKKKNPDGVFLATMHKSKGLEWKVVFVIDCNDGVIPHKNNIDTEQGIEEERRLFYVAMTRAKDSLFVINSSKNESIFIKEAKLMTQAERKMKEEIPKYLPGKTVTHKTFGKGKLVSYGPDTITVRFDGKGMKKFPFPKSFKDGFLKYE